MRNGMQNQMRRVDNDISIIDKYKLYQVPGQHYISCISCPCHFPGYITMGKVIRKLK